jgi:hypothetical protein
MDQIGDVVRTRLAAPTRMDAIRQQAAPIAAELS